VRKAGYVLAAIAATVFAAAAAEAHLVKGSPLAARTGTVAFEAESGLYIIDAKGGKPRKISGTKPGDGNPVWSPDGRQLSFERFRDGSWDVWVMNADGSNQRQLTFSPEDDDFARWAPHGRSLVFQSTRNGHRDVYAIGVRTGAARRVTPGGQYPDMKPDRRIMFAYGGDFFTVRPYGADRRSLPYQPPGSVISALVSHEGRKIAYIADDYGILVADVDGSDWKEITSVAEDDDPSWSPDDEWVVFDRADAIYVVRADGTELTRLTSFGSACCADWRD
jgi:Tol biopolymer transport system component